MRHLNGHPKSRTEAYNNVQLYETESADPTPVSTRKFSSPFAKFQDYQTVEDDNDKSGINRRDKLDMLVCPPSSMLSLHPSNLLRDSSLHFEDSSAQYLAPYPSSLYLHTGSNDTNIVCNPDCHEPQSRGIPSSDQTDLTAFQPENGVQSWLDPYQDTLDIWNDPAVLNLVHMPNDIAVPSPPLRPESRLRHSKKRLPPDRFARVKQLWPTKREIAPPLMLSLWQDVAASSQHGLFSPCEDEVPWLGIKEGSSAHLWWNVDDDCRTRLVQSNVVAIADFPSTETLNMSLDQYFRRFHPRVPIIHRPTFTAKSTPSTLLLSMCLIGLKSLSKGEDTKTFILAQIRVSHFDCPPSLSIGFSSNGLILVASPENNR